MKYQKCNNPLPGGAKFCPNYGESVSASATSPSPILDFSDYIADRTRDFTGREWVPENISGWLAELGGGRIFLLTDGPGTGKTAVAARLVQMSLGLADALSEP